MMLPCHSTCETPWFIFFVSQVVLNHIVYCIWSNDSVYMLYGWSLRQLSAFFAFDAIALWKLDKSMLKPKPLILLDGHNNSNSPKAEQYKLYCTVNLSMNRTWLKYLLCHAILSWLQRWELKGKYVLSTITKLKCTVNI